MAPPPGRGPLATSAGLVEATGPQHFRPPARQAPARILKNLNDKRVAVGVGKRAIGMLLKQSVQELVAGTHGG